MADRLRVVLEIGPNGKRVVAGAYEWPGLDRWGRTEHDALERLSTSVPRYAAVAERAGLTRAFHRQEAFDVVERYAGNTSTDYWGIAHVPSAIETEVLAGADLDRSLALLQACWAHFDDTAARVSAELRPGPRGGGWTRDEIVRHVLVNEPEQFTRKVEVRSPREMVLTPDGLEAHRQETLDAIRAYNAQGKPARTWSIQFLIRRIAHHCMDHAWEMEDRDLTR
ncbi:MAG TPA: hypothetical protein VLB67_08195 [Acidimicrobiia bacterium]|nr:hypothetical protein [Acidimicrobiia bacterium]